MARQTLSDTDPVHLSPCTRGTALWSRLPRSTHHSRRGTRVLPSKGSFPHNWDLHPDLHTETSIDIIRAVATDDLHIYTWNIDFGVTSKFGHISLHSRYVEIKNKDFRLCCCPESSEAQNDCGQTAECTGWSGEAGCRSTTLSALESVLLIAYILARRLTKHRMQSADSPSMEKLTR